MKTRPRTFLFTRVIAALGFRSRAFAEMADDDGADLQAFVIVLVGSILQASAWSASHGVLEIDAFSILEWWIRNALLWVLWTAALWGSATALVGEVRPSFRGVLRAVGLAWGTSLVYLAGTIPAVAPWNGIVSAVASLWFLALLPVLVGSVFEESGKRQWGIAATAFVFVLFVRVAVPYGVRLVPGGHDDHFDGASSSARSSSRDTSAATFSISATMSASSSRT